MKGKLKRKFLWLDEWHILEQEAWFSDMASEGWQLIKSSKFFATFEQSIPKFVNYRCDIFDPDDLFDNSRIELYKTSGWKHVASRKYIQIFKEVEDGKTTELPTDSEKQAETLAVLNKGLKRKLGLTLLFTVLTLLIQFYMLRLDPVGNYLDDGFISFPFIVVMYIYSTIYEVIGMVQMAKLIRKLKSERSYGYGLSYKWKMNQKKFIGFVATAFIAILMIFSTALILKSESDNVYPEIPEGELAVVELADVIGESEYDGIQILDDNDFYNDYKENSSLFVPRQYELFQGVEAAGVLLEDEGGEYSQTIWSHRYEVRNEWLAKKFIVKLREEYLDYSGPYESIFDDRFDELWIRKDHSYVDVLVRSGKEIHTFSYYGNGPFEGVVEKALVKIGKL